MLFRTASVLDCRSDLARLNKLETSCSDCNPTNSGRTLLQLPPSRRVNVICGSIPSSFMQSLETQFVIGVDRLCQSGDNHGLRTTLTCSLLCRYGFRYNLAEAGRLTTCFLGFLRRPFCCVNGPPLSILSPIGELAISPVDKTRFIVAG